MSEWWEMAVGVVLGLWLLSMELRMRIFGRAVSKLLDEEIKRMKRQRPGWDRQIKDYEKHR